MTLHAWTEPRWNPFDIRWQRHSAGPAFMPLRCTHTYQGHPLSPFVFDGPSPAEAVGEARFGATPVIDLVPLRRLAPIARTVLVADAAPDVGALVQLLDRRPVLVCYVNRVVWIDGVRQTLSAVADLPGTAAVRLDGSPAVRCFAVDGADDLATVLDVLTGPVGRHLLIVGGATADDMSPFADLLTRIDAGSGVDYQQLTELLSGPRTLLLTAAAEADRPPAFTLLSAEVPLLDPWGGISQVDDAEELPQPVAGRSREIQVPDVVPDGGDRGRLDLAGDGVLSLAELPADPLVHELRLDRRIILTLAPVARLRGLRALSLRGVKIDNLRPLGSPLRLESLVIDRDPFDGIDLAGLDSLRHLDLGAMPITDLRFLRYVPQLEDLVIDNSSRTPLDLSPLSDLRHLVRLCVRSPGVTDLTPLAGLPGLASLDISGSRPTSLAPLGALPGLRQLRMIGVDVDLEPVGRLDTLQQLDLDQTAITDLGVLAGLPGLTMLGLSFTAVTDLRPLLDLPALAVVDLTGTDTDDSQLADRDLRIERRL